MEEEICTICGEYTGSAGFFDDSLYYHTHSGEVIGPLCSDCYEDIVIGESQGVLHS